MVVTLCMVSALALLLATPTKALPLAQATRTPTPTLRPIPRLLLKGVSQKSPTIDGQLGGTIEANLPTDGSATPLFNGLFRFDIPGAADGTRVVFQVFDANDNLIYKHTENNKPYCPFQDTNGQCNPMPVRDGAFFWPDSDGIAGRPVAPGRYKFRAEAFDNTDNTICFTNGDFEFDIELAFETPVQLPPLTGRARITAPANGSVFRGVVNVRGAATSNNFAMYKFELIDPRCAGGVCFMIDAKRPVANGVLWRWDTRQPLPNGVVLQNGAYVMQLVVADKWGRTLPDSPQIQFTIQN
jgi:hypothetical protein